ncbi:guanylate kinase [Actinobacteria bacterium YIM 96077]|uniref:Guanylate kinase n=1 Tax=Phytoactinopolyspora halophila TaxID=1981511 RepID=A0A329QLU5_9ACTN|nr:guanylate kinase [Phytoactinopolyspora halophila]AYY13542.1 guanylate kinase [Actinobacteria bacterium YIM 96077]RAW12402.1 guanylate kinase [Phytoactinopolyspora halophila]
MGNARVVVLSGPTAVGKTTVMRQLRATYPDLSVAPTVTTRPMRPGEVDGSPYFFVDDETFDRKIDAGEFLEWAVVHQKAKYGTPRAAVEEAAAAGHSVLVEVDLQGARQIRQTMPEAFFVFLAPPSWEELVRRLVGRGTETEAERERRLETARQELAAEAEFDMTVTNHDVSSVCQQLVSLMS